MVSSEGTCAAWYKYGHREHRNDASTSGVQIATTMSRPDNREEQIVIAHGGGGEKTRQLIAERFRTEVEAILC